MFNFCSLYSGSSGNSLFVQTDNTKILVDAGESAKKIETALNSIDVKINDIDAEYISMRVIVHEMYLQDKDFKPMDQQEEAKELFKNRIMKESILKLEHKE